MKNIQYHAVGTVPNSMQKYTIPRCRNGSKFYTKIYNTTLSEQFPILYKNIQYHAVGTVPNSNSRNRDKLDTSYTHIHDHPVYCLGTDTSIKSGGVKLVLWAKS